MTRFGLFLRLASLSAGFSFLPWNCKAQTWAFTIPGTPNTYITAKFTGAPFVTGVGTANWVWNIPVIMYSYQGTTPTPTKANDGLASFTNSSLTNGGTGATAMGIISGAVSVTYGSSVTTTWNSSGGTITWSPLRVIYNGTVAIVGTGGVTVTGSPFSVSFTSTGSVTSSPSVAISQRTLNWTVTNSTGQLGEWGIYQFASSAFTSPTGVVMQLTWISPGGTHTFSLLVASNDPYFYAPAQNNISASWQNGFATASGTNGIVNGLNSVPITSGLSTTLLEGWASGTDVTSLPTVGDTGGSTNPDGGTSGVTSTSGSTNSNLGSTPNVPGTAPTPTTVVSSGGGTLGPGGSSLATDAGAQNNAAAINTGLAAAANAINGAVTSGDQAIIKQIAAGQGNGTGGGSTTNSEAVAADQLANVASAPTLATMQSDGNAQASTEAGYIPGTSTPGTPTVSTTPANLEITFPVAFGGQTIDLNPFESGRAAGVAAAFRSAIQWLLLAWLAVDLAKIIREEVHAMAAARQAAGNSIVGGTGAQATALLAAGAMSIVIVTALATIVGLVANYGFGSLLSYWGTNALGGFGLDAVWMIDQMFPTADIMLFLMLKPFFQFAATKAFILAATAIRFIVP